MRQHLLRPSQCFVLIKQSDSPCPLQFLLDRSLCRERKPESHHSYSVSTSRSESTIHPRASSSPVSAGTSGAGPPHPAARANSFPEVTNLFCRLPLPTLFYRPEAANLGDLMRILVRLGVRISHSIGFSRAVETAPDISNDKMLCLLFNPISR